MPVASADRDCYKRAVPGGGRAGLQPFGTGLRLGAASCWGLVLEGEKTNCERGFLHLRTRCSGLWIGCGREAALISMARIVAWVSIINGGVTGRGAAQGPTRSLRGTRICRLLRSHLC